MIIDADTHITPTGEGILVEELLERMEKAGVDKALTWLQPPYEREIAESNRYVYESVAKHGDKLLGFGWADPNLGMEAAQEMAKKCLYEYDFYGVKLNGAQNSFYVDDPELALPVIEVIADSGKLLAFHVGADAYEHTHPFRVAKVAERFPELQILAVHMGGAGLPSLARAMIDVAADHENITLVGSNVPHPDVLQAIRELGAERVCFGSDTPFRLMHVEVAKYEALLEGEENVTKEAREKIMGDNIARLFDLK